MNADVFDNVSTHNAGGILVFDLPGLPQMGGHSTRIFRNKVVDNDTANFAPKGNIVADVPTGTGVMVMANRDVARLRERDRRQPDRRACCWWPTTRTTRT